MNETQLLARLKAAHVSVATVESCTGGQIASRLTAVAGSSDAFWGGWVVYDNSAKSSQLGIPPELITAKGAVSPEVAGAMAEGGLRVMNQAIPHAGNPKIAGAHESLCVATTGIAGPSGGSPEKPVGLCYVGVARADAPTVVLEVRLEPGQDRQANQLGFTNAALAVIERTLSAWENGISGA